MRRVMERMWGSKWGWYLFVVVCAVLLLVDDLVSRFWLSAAGMVAILAWSGWRGLVGFRRSALETDPAQAS